MNHNKLKRERHPMPTDILKALENNGVRESYYQRPAYQQNDYIGWITSAKQQKTRSKRLSQMIAELKQGGIYMGMDHPPSRKDS